MQQLSLLTLNHLELGRVGYSWTWEWDHCSFSCEISMSVLRHHLKEKKVIPGVLSCHKHDKSNELWESMTQATTFEKNFSLGSCKLIPNAFSCSSYWIVIELRRLWTETWMLSFYSVPHKSVLKDSLARFQRHWNGGHGNFVSISVCTR